MGGSAQGDRPLSRRASAQPSSSAPRPPPLPRLIAAQRGRRNVDNRRDRATCIRRDDRGTHRDRDRVRLVEAQGRPRADPPRLHDRGGDAPWRRSARPGGSRGRSACCSTTSRARLCRALPVVRRADMADQVQTALHAAQTHQPAVRDVGIKAGSSTCSRAGCTPPGRRQARPARACRSASRRSRCWSASCSRSRSAAYWIFERDRTVDLVASLLPRPRRKTLRDTWTLIDQKLGAFVRGELVLIAFVSTLASIALWVVGEPYWLLIGIASGSSRSSRWSGRSRRSSSPSVPG